MHNSYSVDVNVLRCIEMFHASIIRFVIQLSIYYFVQTVI